MNSRKAVSIITKICLSSFQKVLGNLTLLPNHFLILARPIWGCVLQYQHSEKGKKASNLSSCLSITGPWRTATEQVLASLSGLAPATKTSPPRHKFSSTRVLWHFPAREQCHTHTHTLMWLTACRHTRHPKISSAVWADVPEEDHSLWAQTDKSRCSEPPLLPGWLTSHPTHPAFSLVGLEWVTGWLALLALCGWHPHSWFLIQQALEFHSINPLPPENKRHQKVKWPTIDKITSDTVHCYKPLIFRLKIWISCCIIVTRIQCLRGNTGPSAGQFSSLHPLKSHCICN